MRLESAKALVNIPDPEAIPGLIARLEGHAGNPLRRPADGPWPRKRMFASPPRMRFGNITRWMVAHTLVRYLNEPDFGVAWQSRQSLIALTGRDLDYDQNAWLQFLVGPGGPFG